MFKKLLGGDKVPQNDGATGPMTKVDSSRWVKEYELVLSNMEDSPSYPLTHQLSIGSEIGNVVIADPSISPRHCTFILQQNIISVLDHGSVSGTFVNGKKIPPAKYIILEETDVVVVGDLEVHIKSKTVESPPEYIPEIPEVAKDKTRSGIHIDKLLEATKDTLQVSTFKAPEDSPPAFDDEEKKKGKNKTKKKNNQKNKNFSSSEESSTNSITRVFAVICDVLLAYSVYVVFSPFDQFRSVLNFIPSFFVDLLSIDVSGMWSALTEDFVFLKGLSADMGELFTEHFHIGHIFLLFILIRLVTTLVMGVSISEMLLGVKAYGNGTWNRIGGFLRVIVGIFTGPFLIFDSPSIISRRTLKEFLTFTRTYVASKTLAVLGVILFVPLFLGVALFSPLIQGLEPISSLNIEGTVEQRVKVTPADSAVSTGENLTVSDSSQFYQMELSYNPNEVSIVPFFKFLGNKSKTQYQHQMAFFHKDLQKTVTFEVFKKFDLKQLLAIGLRGNYFLFNKYPQIHDFVYASADLHPSLKGNSAPVSEPFMDEMVSFTKESFNLSMGNALDVMQDVTPLIRGLVDYRGALLSLLEYKDFDSVNFIKIGNVVFMRFRYLKQKPFDLILPLVKGDGRIYKVEFDSKENLEVLSSKFYKFTLVNSNWSPEKKVNQNEAMSPMQVLDVFSDLNFKKKEIAADKAQALYGYFFEKSTQVLTDMNPIEYNLWKESVTDALEIMKVLSEGSAESDAPSGEDDPRLKLFQNFKDLKDAVDSSNKSYFGIQNPRI